MGNKKIVHKVAVVSDPGNVREINEDSYLVRKKEIEGKSVLLATVCNGMGGMAKGDYASGLLVHTISDWWNSFEGRDDSFSLSSVADELCFQIEAIHERIFAEGEVQGKHMGSTLVLVFMIEDEFVWLQAGDSRIYLIDKEIYQITVDHTWCQDEVNAGRMTIEQMNNSGKKHILSNAVGAKKDFFIKRDYSQMQLGQRLLLCSDGFYSYLDENELSEKRMFDNLEKLLNRSADRIKKGEADDNFTACLIEI